MFPVLLPAASAPALVLAAFWGFSIWGEVPGVLSAVGIVLILGSGVLVGAREAWKRTRPDTPATGVWQ